MHFSFSAERFQQSRKYRNDIEHDASLIGKTYREGQAQKLFALTHALTAGKDCGMKLVNFSFSNSSELQYLMAVRNVRCEMIRVLESAEIPESRAIIEELKSAIKENRDLDAAAYRNADLTERAENGKTIDARKDYEMLLRQYPSEAEAAAEPKPEETREQVRVPIRIGEETDAEFSPFLENNHQTIQNEKRRES